MTLGDVAQKHLALEKRSAMTPNFVFRPKARTTLFAILAFY